PSRARRRDRNPSRVRNPRARSRSRAPKRVPAAVVPAAPRPPGARPPRARPPRATVAEISAHALKAMLRGRPPRKAVALGHCITCLYKHGLYGNKSHERILLWIRRTTFIAIASPLPV